MGSLLHEFRRHQRQDNSRPDHRASATLIESGFPLRLGLQLPQWGRSATREGVIETAKAAEAHGFDSVWASDHIVYPLGTAPRYPYGTQEVPFSPDEGYLEVLTTLAVVAGATSTVRLGTSVLVLPMRELLITAKVISTLDVLASGRTVIALAAGWWQEEFEALGVNFASRGPRFDEQLGALMALWKDGCGQMSGHHVAYPQVMMEPKPLQKGGPEIWIGGSGVHAWKRVAQPGVTGWHGIGHRAETFDTARAGIASKCFLSGRDPSSIRLSTTTGLPSDPKRAAERILALVALGVSQVSAHTSRRRLSIGVGHN